LITASLVDLRYVAIYGMLLKTLLHTHNSHLVTFVTDTISVLPLTIVGLGVFFSELVRNFKSFRSGNERYKLRFYIGHDGTMIRLASGLGLGKNAPLRWPAMGSEIVMEVRGAFQKKIGRSSYQILFRFGEVGTTKNT
jgi:hypothetical protein